MRKNAAILIVRAFMTVSCLSASLPEKAEHRTITIQDEYSTLQGAINFARQGDTIFIRKGTCDESINHILKIDKTLSIIGENSKNTATKLYSAYNLTWILTQPFYEIANAPNEILINSA